MDIKEFSEKLKPRILGYVKLANYKPLNSLYKLFFSKFDVGALDVKAVEFAVPRKIRKTKKGMAAWNGVHAIRQILELNSYTSEALAYFNRYFDIWDKHLSETDESSDESKEKEAYIKRRYFSLYPPDLSQPNAASVAESSKRLLAVRLRSKRIKPSVTDPFMCPMSRDVNHYIAKQVMSNPLWNRYNKYDRLIQNALKVCPAHLRPTMCQINQVKDYLRNCKSMNESVENPTTNPDKLIGWAWNAVVATIKAIGMGLPWPKDQNSEIRQGIKRNEWSAVSFDKLDKTFSVFLLKPNTKLVLKIRASDAFKIQKFAEEGEFDRDGSAKFITRSPESVKHFADVVRKVKSVSLSTSTNESTVTQKLYCKMNESLDQIRSKISKLTVTQLKDALKMANKRYDQGSDTVNIELMNELEKRMPEKEFVKFLDSLNESLEPSTKVKVRYYLAPKSLQPQIVAIENGVIVSVMNHFDRDRNIVAVEGDEIDVQRYVSGLEPFEGDVQDFVSERKRK
jgi:hypothetical protein